LGAGLLRYTFFEFRNFKGIRHARVELSPQKSAARVYTLVGLNESGKTTVLEAIDHFQGTTEDEVSPKQLLGWDPPAPHRLIPIAERTNFTGEVEISCGVELDENDFAAAREHMRALKGYRLESLGRDLVITDRHVFQDSRFIRRTSLWRGLDGKGKTKKGRVLRDLSWDGDRSNWQELSAFVRKQLPSIWLFPNFLFDFPDKIYLEDSEDESESNRFFRHLFQDVLSSLPKELNLRKHVIDRARSSSEGDKNSLEAVLLEASRTVTDNVISSWNRIFKKRPISDKQVRIEIGADETDATDENGEALPPPLWIRFRLEDADGPFAVRDRSLGFRWFFVYSLVTTYRGRRKGSSEGMLFLFDEPASNLHSTAQAALLSSIGDLSKQAVVIYTTHSQHLIEPAWLGTTFVVRNKGLDPKNVSADFTARRTDIEVTPYRQFAASHPDQWHYFQPILDVLDYVPAQIELIPDAIMVEGKTDFYALKYFQDVLQATGTSERLSLMPGGGAGNLDQPIQLYIGWSRPFVALLDSDREGARQRLRYVDKFGPLVEPHLIDLATASGKKSVKGMESLIADSDQLKFQRLIDPASTEPDKKLLALGVQEALVGRQRVALTKPTRTGLERTLASLDARLVEVKSAMRTDPPGDRPPD